MNSATGVSPPLHRRFNEQKAFDFIRNRYHQCYKKIAEQVKALQADAAFRNKCQEYYKRGYKDWVIVSAIFNCMLNWKAHELSLPVSPESARKQFLDLQNLLSDTIYPTWWFLGSDMDFHIQMHCLNALITYGFEPRRRDFRPDVVEKFLRERMRHFEFDIPHTPFFGEPPGDWPETLN